MEREEWKIVVYGKQGVGTSSFVVQHVQRMFLVDYDPTIGEDCYRKMLTIDDQVCICELIDIYNGESYNNYSYKETILKQGQGFILAYSHRDRDSFLRINTYIDEIIRSKNIDINEIPIVLIETKCDLVDREVSIEEGKNLAAQYGWPFFSTSAKNAVNVEESVFELIRIMRRKAEERMNTTAKKKNKTQPIKKTIPTSSNIIPPASSTLIDDIQRFLFDVSTYSDLTIVVGDRSIYVHKAVLFARLPSFMEKIAKAEKAMDLSNLNYNVVYSIMKYLYIGKFHRENVSIDLYKPAIMKLEVYNLLPILKKEDVDIEGFEPKFELLFNLNFSSDLKIIVREPKKNDRELFCHKMILCARSEYFRTMYQAGFMESDAPELLIEDCSYEAMTFLLKYYYLDVKEIEDDTIVCDLLRAAHRYNERSVIQLIESFFLKKLTIENVCYILMLNDLFSLSNLLLSACEEFISYRFKKVSKTSSFKKLSPEVQKQLETAQKEGPWLVPKSTVTDKLLKSFKSFTL